MRRALVLAVFLSASAAAQGPVPDPTPPEAYVPMTVGDVREYANRGLLLADPDVPLRERRAVVRDTVAGGRRYLVETVEHLFRGETAWRYASRRVVRFDADGSRLVHLRDGGGEWVEACGFDAAFEAQVACGPDDAGSVVVGGLDATIPFGVDPEATLDVPARKAFAHVLADPGMHPFYAAGIGYAGATPAVCWDCRVVLTYARVAQPDGSVLEVGEAVPVASDRPPGAEGLRLAASPSPTAGPLTLALGAPSGGAAVVEAFDARGRRVWRREIAVRPGTARLAVDAGGWAPGLYVVRAVVDGRAASVTVVRR